MPHRNVHTRPIAGLVSLIALAAAAGGCGSSSAEDNVTPDVEMINRAKQALSTGVLQWVNGTYGASCTTRSGAWSARIAGTDPMTNTALSVVKNDLACALTMTELSGAGIYVATPSIALGVAYAGSASALAASGQPVLFYANSKLSSVAFSANFGLTVLFSDTLSDASGSTSAIYASVSSAGNTEQQVPSPNYAVGFGSLEIQTDVNQVVQTATGTVGLSAGTGTGQTGESYVIDTNQTLGSTFAIIDAAYAAGTQVAPVPATINAADFTLPAATLPWKRNLIILHSASAVKTYQVIRITFNVATT